MVHGTIDDILVEALSKYTREIHLMLIYRKYNGFDLFLVVECVYDLDIDVPQTTTFHCGRAKWLDAIPPLCR